MMNNNNMFGSPVLRECCQQNFVPMPPKSCQPDTPWICGDGEIIPIHYPDGSVQFYFVPKSSYTQYNPFLGSNQTAFPNNNVAWLISGLGQPVHYLNLHQPQVPMYTQQNIIVPPYQLKFHRDSCTSTTDLHYFTPKHNAICFKAETAVQATQPNKISFLTSNNKVIDINICTTKRTQNKAKRGASTSWACAETSQKPSCDCCLSSIRSSSMSSSTTKSELSSDDCSYEGCRENKTLSKTQKPKPKSKKKSKKPATNKTVKFNKISDCCCSDTDMKDDDGDCDESGTQRVGKSKYYSFSRKTY